MPFRKEGLRLFFMKQLIKLRKRRCHVCREIKDVELFEKHGSKPLGHGYRCRKCSWETQKEKKRAFFATAIRKNQKAPFALRFHVLARDNFTCGYCGSKPPEVKLEVDHIVPRSKGGKAVLSNLRTSCYACNIGKGNKIY